MILQQRWIDWSHNLNLPCRVLRLPPHLEGLSLLQPSNWSIQPIPLLWLTGKITERYILCNWYHWVLTHSHTITPFDGSGKKAFWKHSGKRRNCLYKQFLLFPQCFFYSIKDRNHHFDTFNLSSAIAFNLVWSKILLCGNWLERKNTFHSQEDFVKREVSASWVQDFTTSHSWLEVHARLTM